MSNLLPRLCACAALLVFGLTTLRAQLFPINEQVPARTLVASATVTLDWNPSPDSNVVGYFLCWGRVSGDCTNQMDIGNATSATLGGLEAKVSYHFTVIAYDGQGEQSRPSNEIEYVLPEDPPSNAVPRLNFELQNDGKAEAVLRLGFQGNPGTTYHLEATVDLRHWETLWITNCPPEGIVAYEVTGLTNRPVQFFRLLRE